MGGRPRAGAIAGLGSSGWDDGVGSRDWGQGGVYRIGEGRGIKKVHNNNQHSLRM